MMEVLSSAIVIGCVVNMLRRLPFYNYFVDFCIWIKPQWKGKPAKCAYCIGIYISLIIGLFRFHELTELQMVLVTCSAPFVSEFLYRKFDSLPIRLK